MEFSGEFRRRFEKILSSIGRRLKDDEFIAEKLAGSISSLPVTLPLNGVVWKVIGHVYDHSGDKHKVIEHPTDNEYRLVTADGDHYKI